MVQRLLKKCGYLRSCHVLAAAFLLYIGFVALRPMTELWNSTTLLVRGDISLYTYMDSIEELYYGMLTTEKNQPLLQNKGAYINLNGLMANLLSQPEMNQRVKMKNGHLVSLTDQPCSQESIASAARNVAAFAQAQQSSGKHFLFVMAPSQVSPYENLLPTGYADYSNATADTFLDMLARNGVPYLDLRERLHAQGLSQDDAFFATDHHWKPQTGFWAYTEILEKLHQMGAISPVDTFYTDSDNYDFLIYENAYLGSSGKRTGKFFAGTDDAVLIRPRFDTRISITIPDRELSLTGRYEKVSYHTETTLHLSDPDYFNENPYGLYGWGDTKLTQWRNADAPETKNVMLIGDSFGNVPFSLMSLYFSSCDELDMRYYDACFADYYADYQPDIVILEAYTVQSLAENTTYPYVTD